MCQPGSPLGQTWKPHFLNSGNLLNADTRTTTLNTMIRTITVEEGVLDQPGAGEENKKNVLHTSHLIGNYYV